MAITYTWTISNVENTIATGGINLIHWSCSATETVDSVKYAANNYGTVGCEPDPSASDFIAYADVTEADCLAWVQAEIGKETTEAKLAAKIELEQTPTTATGVPW
jgi:hypothetical protein